MAKRIEFIDLAKGVCIMLVVMIHIGVPEYIPGLYAAKVPIFFVLSGLFFLRNGVREGYVGKIARTIALPFVLYYALSYAMFYAIMLVRPAVLGTAADSSIIDLFCQRQLFNGPLWFLVSLAEVELLFWLIWKYIRSEKIRAMVVFGFASIGFILSKFDVFVPLWLDTSCVAALYFYFGILLSRTDFVVEKSHPWRLAAVAAILYILFLIFPVEIQMSLNHYSSILLTIVSGTAVVGFILIVCKLVNRCAFLTWIGANSLVILCTHHLLYRPVKVFLSEADPLIIFAITMLLEVPLIIAINRWLPVLAGRWRPAHSIDNK